MSLSFALAMMAAIDREVEEDDKRNGIVKRADDVGVKMRNAMIGNAENGNVDDIETANNTKTSSAREKRDSEVGEDDGRKEMKPLGQAEGNYKFDLELRNQY